MLLTEKQRTHLRSLHYQEKDRKKADRIKAILMRDAGCKYEDIAKYLMLNKETIRAYVNDYETSAKLTSNHKGSQSKLDANQTKELVAYLEKNTHPNTLAIIQHVQEKYGIAYSQQGMTDWLHRNGFSYKKAKGVPAKADTKRQEEFIKQYKSLRQQIGKDEKIFFMDAVHPTMATKLGYGWIRKGQDKHVATSASRTRINITGAIDIDTKQLVTQDYKTINSESIVDFLKQLEKQYPNTPRIHVILDQSAYHKSKEVAVYLTESRVQLHFLPPYSPNLNPIERVWKVVNEKVRNNRFFTSPKVFREAILHFLQEEWPQIIGQMARRITDNFQPVKTNFSF